MSSFDNILKSKADGLNTDILTSFTNGGKNGTHKASGGFENDLKTTYSKHSTGVKFLVQGSYYAYWLENGRAKNKKSDHKSLTKFAAWMSSDDGYIIKWCEAKNISKSFAFPIAYEIGREGYEGSKFISKVLTEKYLNDFVKSIGMLYISQIKADILSEFKK